MLSLSEPGERFEVVGNRFCAPLKMYAFPPFIIAYLVDIYFPVEFLFYKRLRFAATSLERSHITENFRRFVYDFICSLCVPRSGNCFPPALYLLHKPRHFVAIRYNTSILVVLSPVHCTWLAAASVLRSLRGGADAQYNTIVNELLENFRQLISFQVEMNMPL